MPATPEQPGSSAPAAGDLRALRRAAVEVLRRLVEGGHESYFAGGCVRDRLMGLEPADYDIATAAHPEQVKSVFAKARFVGEAFGVMLVHFRGITIEVATFRTEGAYADGRRPSEVHFSDAEHDARRRDFTINGMFEDPLAERLVDHVGGQADIEQKVIRAIGDPRERIAEDRLRTLRAVRFAARFGFAIEEATADAIRFAAQDLMAVSRERIGQEVRRMFLHPHRGVAAWEIQYLGLDEAVLGEPHSNVAPTRLGRLPEDVSFGTALAAWILDRHQDDAQDKLAVADRWAEALVLSNAEVDDVKACLRMHQLLSREWDHLGVAGQKRAAASDAFRPALLLVHTMDKAGFVDIRRRVVELEEMPPGLNPQPLLDGDDLIAAGFSPGRAFKRLLHGVYDAQLEGAITSKAEAIELARSLAGDGGESRGGGGSARGDSAAAEAADSPPGPAPGSGTGPGTGPGTSSGSPSGRPAGPAPDDPRRHNGHT